MLEQEDARDQRLEQLSLIRVLLLLELVAAKRRRGNDQSIRLGLWRAHEAYSTLEAHQDLLSVHQGQFPVLVFSFFSLV